MLELSTLFCHLLECITTQCTARILPSPFFVL